MLYWEPNVAADVRRRTYELAPDRVTVLCRQIPLRPQFPPNESAEFPHVVDGKNVARQGSGRFRRRQRTSHIQRPHSRSRIRKGRLGLRTSSRQTFVDIHAVPHPASFGDETWDRTADYGANDGMSCQDTSAAYAYLSTGGPKQNFTASQPSRRNLLANCLLAVECRPGQRLWQFQEFDDLWDRILRSPNLATIPSRWQAWDASRSPPRMATTLVGSRLGQTHLSISMRRAPTSDLPGEIHPRLTNPTRNWPDRFAKNGIHAADSPTYGGSAAFRALRFTSCTTGFSAASMGHPN